jgi:hypothetical protein
MHRFSLNGGKSARVFVRVSSTQIAAGILAQLGYLPGFGSWDREQYCPPLCGEGTEASREGRKRSFHRSSWCVFLLGPEDRLVGGESRFSLSLHLATFK